MIKGTHIVFEPADGDPCSPDEGEHRDEEAQHSAWHYADRRGAGKAPRARLASDPERKEHHSAKGAMKLRQHEGEVTFGEQRRLTSMNVPKGRIFGLPRWLIVCWVALWRFTQVDLSKRTLCKRL